METVPVLLASGSPRRFEILTELKLDFEVETADIDESPMQGETAADTSLRLALAKAKAVAAEREDALVIAADSLVTLPSSHGNGMVAGKPEDASHAVKILKSLSGKTHEVVTALAFVRECEGLGELVACRTRVTFHDLSDEDIDSYISTGEYKDKAGGYAIQGEGGKLVKSFSGSYTNIVGLPVTEFWRMAIRFGIERMPWRDD